ncbi:DUF4349 domain-containing protein [Marinactinospora rubrisoli]|uniref:DUF4349 domain-containing protein n=1 Tax=Marinactinospora rubrisoli TaxID=2715399 RepID=A0ABW2KDG0_9ACTN
MHPSRTARGLAAPVVASLLAGTLLAGCSGGLLADRASLPESVPAPAEQSAARDGAAAGGVGTDVDVSERTVAHTADVGVRVPDVDAAADEARAWVAAADGYVASESLGGDGGPETATLSLRVPVDRYEEALEIFGGLGERLRLSRSADDMTEEVADVESRVASAEASLERLRALLEDARSVEEVLAVETEISGRQADLEALQARRQALAGQTAYGTVNLELVPPRTAAGRDGSGGFVDGVLAGWAALLAVLRGGATAAGWLLPFVAAAAVPGVPAWWLWRRRRARAGGAAEAPRAAEAGPGGGQDAAGAAEAGAPPQGPDATETATADRPPS